MGLVSWLLTGLLVGAIARLLVRGHHNLGCIGTIGLGVLGSVIGGTLFNALAGNAFQLKQTGFWGSIIGAVLLLVFARLIGGGSRAPRRFEDDLDRRR